MNRPSIQGELLVKHWQLIKQVSFLSLEDALFLLCPWFFHEDFYTAMTIIEASEDTGFHCFFISPPAAVCYIGRFLFPSSPAFLGIFRARGSVRIMGVWRWRTGKGVRRWRLPESPSTCSGDIVHPEARCTVPLQKSPWSVRSCLSSLALTGGFPHLLHLWGTINQALT